MTLQDETGAPPAIAAYNDANKPLLHEVLNKTIDLADTLGKKWGIPSAKSVRTYARSFISSKSAFGEEVVHQFMTVCSELDLNPARKEVAAFYDPNKGLTSFVMIDGWLTLANRHPDYDGYKLHEKRDAQGGLVSIRCEIFRRGRGHPTEATVKMTEWRIGGSPQWMSKPEWMLGMKGLKQGIRLAFGFAGITDDDEAIAMHKEPEPKQEPKGAQMADLKAAAAPPADEHDRKKAKTVHGAETTTTPPAKSLKLEDAKPPAPNSVTASASPPVIITHPDPNTTVVALAEPETSPLGNPLPEPVKQEAAPIEPPKAEVAQAKIEPKPELGPITCGKDGSKAIKKQIEAMNAAEVKFAVVKNAADMLITKDPKKVEARKVIEAALVERGLELGMTADDFEADDFKQVEEGPKEAPPAPSEPVKQAEAPKTAPEPANAPEKAIDAKGAAAWVTGLRKTKKLALGVFAKLAGLDPSTMAALESGDAESWKRLGDDTVREMGRILGDPEAATLMGLLGRA